MSEEKTIFLNRINNRSNTTMWKTIGVSKEEYQKCADLIRSQNRNSEELTEKLGLTTEEIRVVIENAIPTSHIYTSKCIVELWKRHGKDKITLLEFVGTDMLLINMIEAFNVVLPQKKIIPADEFLKREL